MANIQTTLTANVFTFLIMLIVVASVVRKRMFMPVLRFVVVLVLAAAIFINAGLVTTWTDALTSSIFPVSLGVALGVVAGRYWAKLRPVQATENTVENNQEAMAHMAQLVRQNEDMRRRRRPKGL